MNRLNGRDDASPEPSSDLICVAQFSSLSLSVHTHLAHVESILSRSTGQQELGSHHQITDAISRWRRQVMSGELPLYAKRVRDIAQQLLHALPHIQEFVVSSPEIIMDSPIRQFHDRVLQRHDHADALLHALHDVYHSLFHRGHEHDRANNTHRMEAWSDGGDDNGHDGGGSGDSSRGAVAASECGSLEEEEEEDDDEAEGGLWLHDSGEVDSQFSMSSQVDLLQDSFVYMVSDSEEDDDDDDGDDDDGDAGDDGDDDNEMYGYGGWATPRPDRSWPRHRREGHVQGGETIDGAPSKRESEKEEDEDEEERGEEREHRSKGEGTSGSTAAVTTALHKVLREGSSRLFAMAKWLTQLLSRIAQASQKRSTLVLAELSRPTWENRLSLYALVGSLIYGYLQTHRTLQRNSLLGATASPDRLLSLKSALRDYGAISFVVFISSKFLFRQILREEHFGRAGTLTHRVQRYLTALWHPQENRSETTAVTGNGGSSSCTLTPTDKEPHSSESQSSCEVSEQEHKEEMKRQMYEEQERCRKREERRLLELKLQEYLHITQGQLENLIEVVKQQRMYTMLLKRLMRQLNSKNMLMDCPECTTLSPRKKRISYRRASSVSFSSGRHSDSTSKRSPNRILVASEHLSISIQLDELSKDAHRLSHAVSDQLSDCARQFDEFHRSLPIYQDTTLEA